MSTDVTAPDSGRVLEWRVSGWRKSHELIEHVVADLAGGREPRALVVIVCRAGLRINEAPPLAETDLYPRRGSMSCVTAEAASDTRPEWATGGGSTSRLATAPPVGPFLCVIEGATRGRPWSQTGARRVAIPCGARCLRRRFAPNQLRHAPAVETAREGVPLPVIQRQFGHAHLGEWTPPRSSTPSTPVVRHDPGQRRSPTLTNSTTGRRHVRTTNLPGGPRSTQN
jgi:hypothetical protein